MTDAAILLPWLVVLHLVAETVLRVGAGRGAPRRTIAHAVLAAAIALATAAAYGGRGLAYAALIGLAHLVVDGLTRRREVATDRDPANTATALDAPWSARPAAMLAFGQAVHLLLIGLAWLVLFAPAAPGDPIVTAAAAAVTTLGPDVVHRVGVVLPVALALALLNGPFAARFIAVLLPRPAPLLPPTPTPATPAAATPASVAWEFRFAGLRGSATPQAALPAAGAAPAPADAVPADAVATGARADPDSPLQGDAEPRVGRAIGVFERAITVVLVLAHAEASVALIGGVKTIARFRQLEDRAFAEYYLLGTLASLSFGFGSALLARWWLGI